MLCVVCCVHKGSRVDSVCDTDSCCCRASYEEAGRFKCAEREHSVETWLSVCVRSSRQKKKTNLRESQMTIWTVLDFSCLELNEKIDTLLWREALMTRPTGDPVVYVIMWAPWSRFPPVCSTKWDLLCRGVLWELVKEMCVQHWLKFSTERK